MSTNLVHSLAEALTGASLQVVGVLAPSHAPEHGKRLMELGFLRGEPVRVLRRAFPGGDPLMVRVGDSTFALRRAEAGCVQVSAASVL